MAMDVREKLTELLRESPYSIYGDRLKSCFSDSCIKRVAEYLTANGVTVPERISVKDRLPDNKEHDGATKN